MACNCWPQTSEEGQVGSWGVSSCVWKGRRGRDNGTRKTGTIPRYAWCLGRRGGGGRDLVLGAFQEESGNRGAAMERGERYAQR